jgi:RimJ/RimL family protein N-acetyltransferase
MIPTPLDVPRQIETARMIIRCPRPGDGRIVNEAIHETFASLHIWMPWAKTLQTPAESENFAREAAARYHKVEDFAVTLWDKQSGEFIGASGLHPRDWSVPSFEIGYWVRASREGQGYVTEAVMALTAFAFEQFGAQRVMIRCDARNRRSAAVAERAGYTLEGVLRNEKRANDGNLRDTLVYARIADK